MHKENCWFITNLTHEQYSPPVSGEVLWKSKGLIKKWKGFVEKQKFKLEVKGCYWEIN
jgi:hypothetical protein